MKPQELICHLNHSWWIIYACQWESDWGPQPNPWMMLKFGQRNDGARRVSLNWIAEPNSLNALPPVTFWTCAERVWKQRAPAQKQKNLRGGATWRGHRCANFRFISSSMIYLPSSVWVNSTLIFSWCGWVYLSEMSLSSSAELVAAHHL